MADELVNVTTWSTKKRHYADLASMKQGGAKVAGLQGQSICAIGDRSVEVFDQPLVDAIFGVDESPPVITELPECRLCRRELDRRTQTKENR